ncbi:hypothetical protein [Microseira wollei]|uniref:hypothetical protein n=1 Tax=Microseira wollei TaxID=467598 RepID=UPI001CFF4558|nr:hypothetical protein [Microseira wollei]
MSSFVRNIVGSIYYSQRPMLSDRLMLHQKPGFSPRRGGGENCSAAAAVKTMR